MIELHRRFPDFMTLRSVALGLRDQDRDELAATSPGVPHQDALAAACEASDEVYVGVEEDLPVFLGGIRYADGVAHPWLLGGELQRRNELPFLRLAKELVARWGAAWHLEQWVDARNTTSLRWLFWMGFQKGPVGYVNDHPFIQVVRPIHV